MTKQKIKKNVRPGDITFTKPSRTKQSFRDEVDINQVIRRYHSTGVLPQNNTHELTFGDYSNPIDFHEAQNKIMRANDLFYALPSHIRREFNDNPGDFLNFAQNPDNQDAMEDMGLLPPSMPSESTETHGDQDAQSGENGYSGDGSDNPTEPKNS